MNTKLTIIGVCVLLVAATATFWMMEGAKTPQQPVTTNGEMLISEPKYAVSGTDVIYTAGITGYYARPTDTKAYPGVVMIHEWWGLNEHIKQMARELAGQGYQVLAVDLHKGQVATTPDEARQLTGSLDQDEARANLRAAVAYLRSNNASRIASLGWCFGGGQSLQLALSGEELDATIVYYGSLVTDTTELSAIDWPVLGVFGDQDQSIPVERVQAFETALDVNGTPNEIYIYDGVGHAFANPSGANYAPDETKDAWTKTLEFLARTLY